MSLDDEMRELNDPTVERLIGDLMDEKNIRMKTEIPNVFALEGLRMWSKWYKLVGFDEAADAVDHWIDNFLLDMPSSERKSRQEYVNAIVARKMESESFEDRLMGGPKE